MLNGIIDFWKVRAQKDTASSQSTGGSSFVPHRSEDQLEIERLKESMWQRDEEMRQQDDFYAQAFAQQQIVLQITFKTNSLHCNMYSN
jgi:hypothetical protein